MSKHTQTRRDADDDGPVHVLRRRRYPWWWVSLLLLGHALVDDRTRMLYVWVVVGVFAIIQRQGQKITNRCSRVFVHPQWSGRCNRTMSITGSACRPSSGADEQRA